MRVKRISMQVLLASVIAIWCVILAAAPNVGAQGGKFERESRARDLGVPFEGTPGPRT
jgi:hypothetical protein